MATLGPALSGDALRGDVALRGVALALRGVAMGLRCELALRGDSVGGQDA